MWDAVEILGRASMASTSYCWVTLDEIGRRKVEAMANYPFRVRTWPNSSESRLAGEPADRRRCSKRYSLAADSQRDQGITAVNAQT